MKQRTESELQENCIARDVTGGSCQYPECGCFDAADYYAERDELHDALREMVEAHSLSNIGLEASKRRLAAIKRARELLDR